MAPCTDQKPIVFVSYDRNDKAVDSLVRHIRNYPKSDGIVYRCRELEIEPGYPINWTLRSLIEQCIVYIVIFSENYPASNSCLLELAMIVAATSDKYLLPVFYGAGTDDVKLKTEKYNEQLCQHFPGESEATLQEWKDALLAAARICGFDQKPTEGRICRDADLCSQIVDRVLDLIKEKDVNSLTATIRGCPKLQSVAGLRLGSTSPTYVTIENCVIRVLFDPSQLINLIVKMTLLNCDNLEEVPFEQLKSLMELDVEGCSSIVSLSGVDNAGKLQKLHVRRCQNLRVIEDHEGVREFSIHDCGSLPSLNSKISMDKSEIQQPRSSQEASSSSSSSLTKITQQDVAEEKLIVENLSQFL